MDAAPYRAGDRRPIAVRHWRVFQSLAAYLARLGVSPNAISLAGMGFGILAGVALGLTACAAGVEERLLWVAAANQEFCGPMAKQQRMFLVTGVALYCALAPLTWRPVWAPWPGRSVMAGALVLILAGCLVTVWRRLRRIAATLRK